MTQRAPEFKVLQSIAFLAVVLQSSLLYTMNQGNLAIEQYRTLLYKWLRFIENFTYGAYLAHFFFLNISVKLLSFFALPANSILYSICLFSCTAILSLGTIIMFSYIPFHKWITGPTPSLSVKWIYPTLSLLKEKK